MKRTILTYLAFCAATLWATAQNEYSQIDPDGNITQRSDRGKMAADSLGSDKEIPQGLRVWTVDERFGDRYEATADTLSHMYMNTIFTTGLRGEYNTTGNLGAPRINRIFIDRPEESQFIFMDPYDYFNTPIEDFHFTNTLSPITNLSYNTAGDRITGEDRFTARFAVNAGKKLGVGFKTDYLYGRGYYQNQSTSLFNLTLYGSYIGDRYQAHLLLTNNHQKVAENGGITDDYYITHPESFSDSYNTNEIPTMLAQNWNRNDNQHVFFTHRYSVGFHRKVRMTDAEIKARKFAMASKEERKERDEKGENTKEGERQAANGQRATTFAGRPDDAPISDTMPDEQAAGSGRIAVEGQVAADSLLALERKAAEDSLWLKDEYVPVTSFIHTLKFDNYRRIYQAYEAPEDYYANTYYYMSAAESDSTYDKTRHYSVTNTFAIALLEGFNKWAKAGLKAFATHELRRFTLPNGLGGEDAYNENCLFIGGQLRKEQGRWLHYDVAGDFCVVGSDLGDFSIDANADLNLPLLGDTVQVAAKAFLYRYAPGFYMSCYHSRHAWWDIDDQPKTTHTRLEGSLAYPKTGTTLRLAVDEIKDYTYFGVSYATDGTLARSQHAINSRQCGDAISLLTLSLSQNFKLGPLMWESVVTFQKSSKDDVIPLPRLNIYSNLFLRFKIARVLSCDFGGDVRYFSKYHAPYYAPSLGMYAIQENEQKTETGNYPLVGVYANFHLKHTRFFVMMSHVNAGSGSKNYFLTPHYPLNERVFRFGVSWNFFN